MHYLVCQYSNLYHVYNNNYENNYSLVFLICLQPLYKNLFVIPRKWLFAIQITTHLRALIFIRKIFTAVIFKYATYLNSRLTEILLNVVCFVLPFYSPTTSVWGTFWCRPFLFSPSRELYCDRLYMCILKQVFSSCSFLVVYLKGIRCIC